MVAYTEISICETALMRLGVSAQITDSGGSGLIAGSTDNTKEQRVCEFWYSKERDKLLSVAPWRFARGFASLTLLDDGTGEVWDEEWENAYTYPSDCLKIRRFVNDVGTNLYQSYEDTYDQRLDYSNREWPFVVRRHKDAVTSVVTKAILTDVATNDADIEYTVAVTLPAEFPDLFADTLSYKLAAEMVGPLQGDQAGGKRIEMLKLYLMSLKLARAYEINEERPHGNGNGDFVRARGGD